MTRTNEGAMLTRIHMEIDTMRQTVQGLVEGAAPAKAAMAGLSVLLSAIWSALTSVLAAVLCFVWLLDMAAGMIVAWDRGTWSWPKFWGGFRKLAIAGVAIGLGVSFDMLLGMAGSEIQVVSVGTMGILIAAFGGSAAGNIGKFFPEAGDFLLAKLPQREVQQVDDETMREEVEIRRGNPPAPGATRGKLNGTDN